MTGFTVCIAGEVGIAADGTAGEHASVDCCRRTAVVGRIFIQGNFVNQPNRTAFAAIVAVLFFHVAQAQPPPVGQSQLRRALSFYPIVCPCRALNAQGNFNDRRFVAIIGVCRPIPT